MNGFAEGIHGFVEESIVLRNKSVCSLDDRFLSLIESMVGCA